MRTPHLITMTKKITLGGLRTAEKSAGDEKSLARYSGGFLVRGLAFSNPSVAALALLKLHQRFQQPCAVEIRPQRVGYENLRIGDLPEQKIAHAHLAARSNQQIGVWQALRVQMPRDLFRRNSR